MEHIKNFAPQCGSARRAVSTEADPTAPAKARRLPDRLVGKALHAGRDRRSGRAQRTDGWTPERIRAFLEILAHSGSVAAAAHAVGMSRQSAYALRRSVKGRAFGDAWCHALLLAAPVVPDDLMERAIAGQVDHVIRNGEVTGQRHHFDNRLALRVLRQLDRLAVSQSPAAKVLRAVAAEFDAFVDIVASGDEAAADAFLSACGASAAMQSRDLSTLPAAAETCASQSRDLSTLPAAAEPRAPQSPDLSTLPLVGPGRHDLFRSALPGPALRRAA